MLRLVGAIAPGQQLTIQAKIAPDRAFKPTVTEFEPDRKMVWRSGMPMGLFQGARTFLLEPLPNERTRFTLREEFSGLLLTLFGRSIPDMNPVFAAFNAALKERAERK
jgi:hypothetical protein